MSVCLSVGMSACLYVCGYTDTQIHICIYNIYIYAYVYIYGQASGIPSPPSPNGMVWYGGGGLACAERGGGRWSCSWRNGQASQTSNAGSKPKPGINCQP